MGGAGLFNAYGISDVGTAAPIGIHLRISKNAKLPPIRPFFFAYLQQASEASDLSSIPS
jgi:hypothetical protein